MLPTLVFIGSIIAVIVVGLFALHTGPDRAPRGAVSATEALGILLILKAFAAGCSAVTGVEAIANGVPAFKRAARPHRAADRDHARGAARRRCWSGWRC